MFEILFKCLGIVLIVVFSLLAIAEYHKSQNDCEEN
jgi:hypothetical protein